MKRQYWLIGLLSCILVGCTPLPSVASKPIPTHEQAAVLSYTVLPAHPLFAKAHKDTIVVLDADTHALVGTITHPDLSGANDLVVTPQGHLYSTLGTDADWGYDVVLVIDAHTGAVLRRFPTADAPFTPRLSPDGTVMIGHNAIVRGGYDVALVDTTTISVTHMFKLPGYLNDAVFDGSTAYLGTSNPDQPELVAYDLATRTVSRTYAFPSAPIHLVLHDPHTLYAVLFGKPDLDAQDGCDREPGPVIRLDPTTGISETITTLNHPTYNRSLLINGQGNLILGDECLRPDGDRVLLFDMTTRSVIRSVDVDRHAVLSPITPRGEVAVFNEDGTVIWLDANTLIESERTQLPVTNVTAVAMYPAAP